MTLESTPPTRTEAPEDGGRWRRRHAATLRLAGLAAVLAVVVVVVSIVRMFRQPVEPAVSQGLTRADEIVVATFPPRWEAGQTWSIEIEWTVSADSWGTEQRRHRGRVPYAPFRRYYAFTVMETSKTLAMVDIRDEADPGRRERLVIGRESLRVERRALPSATPGSLDDPGWDSFQDDAEVFGCSDRVYPYSSWSAPNLELARVGRDEVVSARRGLRPLGTGTQDVELLASGLLEIRVRSKEDLERQTTAVYQWRSHEPWWAKMECDVPGGEATLRSIRPYRDGWRFARARLVSVGDQPVEVLPWTFPPARHFTEPDLPGSDGFGYAGNGFEDDAPYTRLLRVRANNPRP